MMIQGFMAHATFAAALSLGWYGMRLILQAAEAFFMSWAGKENSVGFINPD